MCDNCHDVSNKSQKDSDKDKVGDACEDVCVTILRGGTGNVFDTFLASNAQYSFGGAHELMVGMPPKLGLAWSLLNFDVSVIELNACTHVAKHDCVADGDTSLNESISYGKRTVAQTSQAIDGDVTRRSSGNRM